MQIATISSKRQLTLPKDLLVNFGIKPGTKVILEDVKTGLLIQPLKTSIVRQAAGSLTKYVPSEKLNVPFKRILQETKKIIAKKLVYHNE